MNKLLEPTEAMIDAGRNAALLREDDELHNLHDKAKYVYNAMITKSEAISKLLAVVEAAKEACRHTGGTGKGALHKTLKALEE